MRATAVDLNVGLAATARHLRHSRNDNAVQHLCLWGAHTLPVYVLKVLHVADLRRLRDAFSTGEALPAIVGNRILSMKGKAREEKETANCCACATLSSVAVADDYVLRVFAEEAEHIVAGLEENVNGGRVVVLPLEATHSVVSKLLEVVRTVAKVINAIRGAVFALEEGCHVGDVIAVEGLHAASRKRHGEHTTSDIRNIKVELLVLKAMPLAAYNASKPIHKNNRFLFLEPLLAVL